MDVLKYIVAFGAYFGLAKTGLTIGLFGSQASPIWFPSGVAMVSMVTCYRWQMALAMYCAAFAANVTWWDTLTGIAICQAAGIAVGNATEAVVAAALLRAGRPFLLFVAVALSTCAISAWNGPQWLLWSKAISADVFHEISFTWWAGDMIGMTAFYPLYYTWLRYGHD